MSTAFVEQAREKKQANAVVARVRAHFDSGRTRPLAYRQQQLGQLARFLKEREPEIANAMHSDMGRPAFEVYTAEVAFTATEIAFTRRRLAKWARPERVPTSMIAQPGRCWIYREPVGVVLIVGPWNYPLQLLLVPLVGAIAAGNCAVLKPSEVAPAMSELVARRLPEYVDSDCVQVVEGGIPETTALLAERFDHIFYTGGGSVGRVVMEAAAKHLTPVTLELGGKSPCIVDKTTDLAVAARRIVWGKLFNAGQTCRARLCAGP